MVDPIAAGFSRVPAWAAGFADVVAAPDAGATATVVPLPSAEPNEDATTTTKTTIPTTVPTTEMMSPAMPKALPLPFMNSDTIERMKEMGGVNVAIEVGKYRLDIALGSNGDLFSEPNQPRAIARLAHTYFES